MRKTCREVAFAVSNNEQDKSEPLARKRSEILLGDVEIGYLVFMSVPSVTLTLASLLIIGCVSTEQHPPSLEDSHGFKPTAAYQGGTISETQRH